MSRFKVISLIFPSQELDEAGDILAGEYEQIFESEAELRSEVYRLKTADTVIGFQVLIDEGEAWALYAVHLRANEVWRVQWRFEARGKVWQAGRLVWSGDEARALVMRLNVKPNTLTCKLEEMSIEPPKITPLLALERVWSVLER